MRIGGMQVDVDVEGSTIVLIWNLEYFLATVNLDLIEYELNEEGDSMLDRVDIRFRKEIRHLFLE